MKRNYSHKQHSRRGAITVLTALMSTMLVGMVAFCVDIGYVLSAKEELQRSADSSALAACWEYGQRLSKGYNTSTSMGYARTTAAQYASLNKVSGHVMSVDQNDIVFGYIADFKNSQSPFQTNGANGYNAVRVKLSKNTTINGQVPYFFARIFGLTGQ